MNMYEIRKFAPVILVVGIGLIITSVSIVCLLVSVAACYSGFKLSEHYSRYGTGGAVNDLKVGIPIGIGASLLLGCSIINASIVGVYLVVKFGKPRY